MSSRVVMDGPIATVTLNLTMTGGAGLAPHGSRQLEGSVEDLRSRLSARAREAFDSSEVRVDRIDFTDVAQGSGKAILHVVTDGNAKIAGAGFSTGSPRWHAE